MAWALIFIVVLLVLGGGLITGIVLWSTSGGGGGSNTEMACGACGYAVRGLTQLNCPECGVDLREAGINKPSNLARRRVGIGLTVGSLGVLVLGCLVTGFLSFRVTSPPPSSPSINPGQTTGTSAPPPSQPVTGSGGGSGGGTNDNDSDSDENDPDSGASPDP